jgi:hypothetical protein
LDLVAKERRVHLYSIGTRGQLQAKKALGRGFFGPTKLGEVPANHAKVRESNAGAWGGPYAGALRRKGCGTGQRARSPWTGVEQSFNQCNSDLRPSASICGLKFFNLPARSPAAIDTAVIGGFSAVGDWRSVLKAGSEARTAKAEGGVLRP